MQSSNEAISKVDVLLRESFKVFGHDISQKGGLNGLYHEIIENKQLMVILNGLGFKSDRDQSANPAEPAVDGSPTKSPKKQDKFKMRPFEIKSPSKKSRPVALETISKDNLQRFEQVMTRTFGVGASGDIYPQYQATPLEKSIGITERFFGRKARYYNIMNKPTATSTTNVVTVSYDIHTLQFNPHVDLPELCVQPLEAVPKKTPVARKRWNAPAANDKENQKNAANASDVNGRLVRDQGEKTLAAGKMVHTSTGVCSNHHNSN